MLKFCISFLYQKNAILLFKKVTIKYNFYNRKPNERKTGVLSFKWGKPAYLKISIWKLNFLPGAWTFISINEKPATTSAKGSLYKRVCVCVCVWISVEILGFHDFQQQSIFQNNEIYLQIQWYVLLTNDLSPCVQGSSLSHLFHC